MTDTGAPPASRAAILGIGATVTVFTVSQGLTYPLLSFILNRAGETPIMIGLSAAMTPLGFIASANFVPAIARRIGADKVVLICAAMAALLLSLIAWSQNIWVWFPLRFLLGCFAIPLYVVSETWMISAVPAARRGRFLGVYTAIVSAGFAVGPLVLSFVGSEGLPPFLMGIGAFVCCVLILLAIWRRLPPMQHSKEPVSVAGFVLVAPVLLFAVLVAAAFEQGILSLFAVYCDAYGWKESGISTLLVVFIAGNIALQVPFGMTAERIGAFSAMLACALATVAGCMLLPFTLDSFLVWPVAFVWGAVSYGIYTMALIELGTRFSGPMLITGNAAFALVWGIGGVAGPPFAGGLMELIGVQGLPLALGFLCALLSFFIIRDSKRKRLKGRV